MEKFQKLTVDEEGKLHGGFLLQSADVEIGKTNLNNTNTNCSNGGNGDTNTNCSCAECNSGIKVPPGF